MITFSTGLVLWFPNKKQEVTLRTRDGFLIVFITWVVLSIFSSLPFILSYKPHISLFYGIKDLSTKKALIKKLPKLNKLVTIDKLCIVDVNEKINKWKIIKTIKLKNEKN